jgi:hypothetical protein
MTPGYDNLTTYARFQLPPSISLPSTRPHSLYGTLIRPLEGYCNDGKAAPHLKPHSWGSGGKHVGIPNLGNRWRQFYVPADLPPLPILKYDGLQSRFWCGDTGNTAQAGHPSYIWSLYLAIPILIRTNNQTTHLRFKPFFPSHCHMSRRTHNLGIFFYYYFLLLLLLLRNNLELKPPFRRPIVKLILSPTNISVQWRSPLVQYVRIIQCMDPVSKVGHSLRRAK